MGTGSRPPWSAHDPGGSAGGWSDARPVALGATMSRIFDQHRGAIRARFAPEEVELLRSLQQGIRRALEDGDDDDPVIARLFPRAVSDDDEADVELRRLLRDDLLESRQVGLDALIEVLDRCEPRRGRMVVELEDDEPLLVLGVFNDLRLAIGARIGVDDLDRQDIPPGDPLAYRLAVMDLLGWWQEQLLALLDPEGPG